jgi:hypothetical protein
LYFLRLIQIQDAMNQPHQWTTELNSWFCLRNCLSSWACHGSVRSYTFSFMGITVKMNTATFM